MGKRGTGGETVGIYREEIYRGETKEESPRDKGKNKRGT